MKKIFVGLVAVAIFAIMPMAMAQEVKMGVIDLQKIVQKSPQITRINGELEKQFKPRQTKILAAQKDLEAEVAKLNREGTVMSAADRTKLQGKIITDRANFQGMAETFKQELAAAQNQAMQNFMQQVTAAVGKIAVRSKYTVVLQKAGLPYADPSLDITDQVLNELSKG